MSGNGPKRPPPGDERKGGTSPAQRLMASATNIVPVEKKQKKKDA